MKTLMTFIVLAVLTIGGPTSAAEWRKIVLKSADFAADEKCEIISSAMAPNEGGMIYATYWHCDYETNLWGHDYRCFDYITTPNRASYCEGVYK